jgi:hypothetical protein
MNRHEANLRQIAKNLRESDQSQVIQPVRDHWAALLDEAAAEHRWCRQVIDVLETMVEAMDK